jgi:hypothetical protein
MKKILSFFSILLLLYGCSIIDTKNIAPGYVEAFKTINSLLFGSNNNLITSELIDKIPYASSILKIGKGAPGLIILESLDGEKQTWVSADSVFIVMVDGRIIKTSGLINNLTRYASPFRKNVPLSFYVNNDPISYYSYDLPLLIDLKVKSRIKMVGKEKVTLINQEKTLMLIEEYIENEYLGWKVTNKFWVDDNNFVWKSVQHISPKLPPFYIEVTKKPAL